MKNLFIMSIMRANFLDFIITTVITVIISIMLYGILYDICIYHNLNDFYVGTTIYQNHNKYLDIGIYFIYLVIFLCTIIITTLLREKIETKINLDTIKNFITEKTNKITSFFKEMHIVKFIKNFKLPSFIYKYQWIGALGYILLYPFDYALGEGGFHYKIVPIILILIFLTLLDVYKINKKEQKTISPFILCSLLFTLLFIPFNAMNTFSIDNHHHGESFGTYFQHINYKLEYYKDIMLVHGYVDVAPSFLGHHLFDDTTIYGYKLGSVFLRNIIYIISMLMSFSIFKKAPFFTIPIILYVRPTTEFLFITTFIYILNKFFENKNQIWLYLYIIIAFAFCMYRTTHGSFWFIASMPFATYMIYHICKRNKKTKYLKLSFACLILLILLYIEKDTIYNYLLESTYYIKGNLLSFGNNFSKRNNLISIVDFSIKTFALIILPFFIVTLFKELNKKERNHKIIYFLIFSILFPLVAISYSLGRIDGDAMGRISQVSIIYLCLLLPYYIYLKDKKKELIVAIFSFFCINIWTMEYTMTDLYGKYMVIYNNLTNKKQTNNKTFNIGKVNFPKYKYNNLNDLNNIVMKYSNSNSDFLDITNSGTLYMFLNKKIPIKFVSFYNIPSLKQSEQTLEILKKLPPKIISIAGTSQIHDDVIFPLRMNPVYRWILLEYNYKLIKSKTHSFLIKTDEKQEYTKNELFTLDRIFADTSNNKKNLKHLPEAWGNSIKTLPMTKIEIPYSVENIKDKILIKFEQPIKGKDIDLIHLKPIHSQNLSYSVEINSSDSILKFDSKKGNVLFPFDVFPSWLLAKNIKEITITTNEKINDEILIEFYKRNSSLIQQ